MGTGQTAVVNGRRAARPSSVSDGNGAKWLSTSPIGCAGAFALFDDALNEVSINGERWYEAELLRLKAEMLLAQATPRRADAEQCLQAALALARQQEAKFWELRAATALAEQWTAAGRRDEARELLAPVYGGFTQGPDSPDLKRAAALLA